MVRPIPRRWLIHSVEYEKNLGNGGWDSSYDTPVTINDVRVEPAKQMQRSSNSEGTVVSHVLFIDGRHSSVMPDFKPGDRITFNGLSHEIVNVKAIYALSSAIHHYELELS